MVPSRSNSKQRATADLTATYNVGGYLKDGLASWSIPVDHVLGEQFIRLKSFVETGKPEK